MSFGTQVLGRKRCGKRSLYAKWVQIWARADATIAAGYLRDGAAWELHNADRVPPISSRTNVTFAFLIDLD